MKIDIKEPNCHSRAYSFGVFHDPPGQVWADFVHRKDELEVLAEGEIEVEIEGKAERPQIGEEIIILIQYNCIIISIYKQSQGLVFFLSFSN